MVKRQGDDRTLDLLDWEPKPPVERFETDQLCGPDLVDKIAIAVAAALRSCRKSRCDIAAEMSEYLGAEVSTNMLDAYASQARDTHIINVPRWIALIHVTGDMRLLNVIPEMFGRSVVEDRWLGAIEEAQVADQIDQLQNRRAVARRSWKNRGVS